MSSDLVGLGQDVGDRVLRGLEQLSLGGAARDREELLGAHPMAHRRLEPRPSAGLNEGEWRPPGAAAPHRCRPSDPIWDRAEGSRDRYAVASLGRHPKGAVAQLVAHLHGMEGVRGSSPLSSTESKASTRHGWGPSRRRLRSPAGGSLDHSGPRARRDDVDPVGAPVGDGLGAARGESPRRDGAEHPLQGGAGDGDQRTLLPGSAARGRRGRQGRAGTVVTARSPCCSDLGSNSMVLVTTTRRSVTLTVPSSQSTSGTSPPSSTLVDPPGASTTRPAGKASA